MERNNSPEAPGLVARSPAMRRLVELAERVAGTSTTVLITGETGTGKERLARFIHDRSQRAKDRFLAINCGALPEQLLESELFGHVKGAFTGASHDKSGLFAAARKGTLFLDEIGDTSKAMQLRLLRALQERKIRPVGATSEIAVDSRILAATHHDLEDMVTAGTFRQDLYFRLRVVQLEIPPLRQRREDLPILARELIRQSCREHSCGPCSLSPETLDLLQAYEWPGNVRELANAIERAVVLAENQPQIQPADLPREVRTLGSGLAPGSGPVLPLAELEKRHILSALDQLGGNRKRAAKALGIGETTLWRKLKSYGLVNPRTK